MPASTRITRHLRSNAIAYLALFIALSGTAIALPGKNKVKSNDIARNAVKGKSLRSDSVSTSKIRDRAVSSAKLADGSVINSKLGDAVVTEGKLAEDSVTRQKIVQGTINGGKLANGAIDSAKVADGSLLAEDFAPGQLGDAFLVQALTGPFTLRRPGRVYVSATFRANCSAGPCAGDTYAIEVDGTTVPGSIAGLTQADDDMELITLHGLTAPLAAGAHEIELVPSGDAEVTDASLIGILVA